MARVALGFAFGGGGWLTTWYLGVLQGLLASGAFKPGVTPIAGISTGAQTAALGCSGGDPAHALAGALAAARTCLASGTTPPCRGALDAVLRAELNHSLPAGAAASCGATLALGTSTPRPGRGIGEFGEPRIAARRGAVVTSFTSDQDLVDAVAASGYLACLSGAKPYVDYRGKPTLAGGYTFTMLCPKSVRRCVKIHSGVQGPLFSNGAAPSAAAPAGGGAGSRGFSSGGGGAGEGARRRLQAPPALPTSCPASIAPPTIVFHSRRPPVDIYPGKYNPVDVTWWTWQSWAVEAPNVEGLKYAFDLGVADATAWAKEAKIIK